MSRTPAVANMFYPGQKGALQEQIRGLLKPVASPQKVLAAVSPHAGYMYSGGVAGAVFSRIDIPESVVILGPNHRGLGTAVALDGSDSWEMPLGAVPLNEELAALILDHSAGRIRKDSQAHVMEHSLEVQLPFLQTLRPELSLVPISVSHVSLDDCEKIGQALADGIEAYGKEVLLVASTDMTHYESQKTAQTKDQLAIDRILDLDPRGLYNVVAQHRITMCGVIATTIILFACLAMNAEKAELIQYATSGDVTGDHDQVVGYAGLIIY